MQIWIPAPSAKAQWTDAIPKTGHRWLRSQKDVPHLPVSAPTLPKNYFVCL